MDPEAKSMVFILSQEVKWKLPVTHKSLTALDMKSVCPDLYFMENEDGEVDHALTWKMEMIQLIHKTSR